MLVLALVSDHNPVFAQQRAHAPVGGSNLIAFSDPAGEKNRQLTIIDPDHHTLSVYHVDSERGTVTLKSVRNFQWDLQLLDFNGTDPKPQDLRSMQYGTR